MSFSDQFIKNGDKAFASVTAVCALATAQAAVLHIDPVVGAWITFASGVATILHTVYFPNGPGQSGSTQK